MDFYNTLQELGRGAFSVVYLCEKKHNKEKVVIKEINTDLQHEQLKAARNEVTVLKSMGHPNVVQYYESYIKKQSFYIIMEYANQGNLHDYIAQNKPNYFTAQFVMNTFCQILLGLNHIHSKNIIHRDLKCENIFLTGLKSDVIKIGDFGISKILHNQKAKTCVGTPNYLAPEICDGKEYDTKLDIWSLGCILYELCAMERMFDGTISNVVLSIAHGKKKVINIERYGQQIQDIIESTLKINPEERPTTQQLMALRDVFPTLYSLGSTLGCIDKK